MAHLLSERPSDGGSILGVYARKSCGPECVRPVFHPICYPGDGGMTQANQSPQNLERFSGRIRW